VAGGDDWARFSKYVLGVELDGTEPLPLNRLSQGLGELAERERVAVSELASGLKVVRRGLLGDKRDAFDENVERLVGKDGFLLLAAKSFGDVGKRFEATAVQVQGTRYQSYSVLAELLLEIALAFWFAIFSPYAAFEWLAARMAIARTLLQLLQTRLGGFLLSMVLEPLTEIVVDLLTQASQMTGPGLRRSLDKSSILWSGAGGLLGAPAAHLAHLVPVSKLAHKAGGGKRAGDVADEVFVEGATEVAVEGIITTAAGGSFTAGAAGIAGLSGVFSGVTTASSEYSRRPPIPTAAIGRRTIRRQAIRLRPARLRTAQFPMARLRTAQFPMARLRTARFPTCRVPTDRCPLVRRRVGRAAESRRSRTR
jgi:hypothetical protein